MDAKTTDCTIYGPMKLLFATNFDQTDFSSFIECHWNKWKVLPFILLRRKYRVGAETVTEWRSSNQLCHHLRPLSMEFQLSHLVSHWILVAKRAPVMSILIEGLPLRKVILLYSWLINRLGDAIFKEHYIHISIKETGKSIDNMNHGKSYEQWSNFIRQVEKFQFVPIKNSHARF